MRAAPTYLSPSALACFRKEPEEYYKRYLSDVRAPKIPQTQPMSVGSSFDAHLKSHLHHHLFGPNHKEAEKYKLDAIFTNQVESQNRDWAREAGEYVFRMYIESGALADLMLELKTAIDDPRFEFDVQGTVSHGVENKVYGVPMLGKPDLHFLNEAGQHVVYDFKVNGYCGAYNLSPKPGYVQLREHNGNGWMRHNQHKDCCLLKMHGIFVNAAGYLEQIDSEWATQLASYGWLLGERVGSEFIVGIEQIVANGTKRLGGKPVLRVASHRCRISQRFQIEAFSHYQELWSILTGKPFHFFRDLPLADSETKCATLDKYASAAAAGAEAGSLADWALSVTR